VAIIPALPPLTCLLRFGKQGGNAVVSSTIQLDTTQTSQQVKRAVGPPVSSAPLIAGPLSPGRAQPSHDYKLAPSPARQTPRQTAARETPRQTPRRFVPCIHCRFGGDAL
jgi:hypothetical protein